MIRQYSLYLSLILILTHVVKSQGQENYNDIRIIWDQFEEDWENEDARACSDIYLEEGVHIPPQYTINIGRENVFRFYSLLFKNHLSSEYHHVIDKIDQVSEVQIVELGHFTVDWVRNDGSTWTFNARSLTHWMKERDGHWYIDKFVFNNPVDQEDISELETKWKTAEKEQKILEQELLLSYSKAQRNYLFAGIGGLGLLLLALYNRNRYREKLAEGKITSLEQGQKILALDYMVKGQEQERKRIAQELHDGLGGLMASAKLLINKIDQESADQAPNHWIDEAKSTIHTAHQEVRRISHDMMPGALIDLGLPDAIDDLAITIKRDYKIEIAVNITEEELDIPDHQAIHLYRIIQEILNNTVRHAHADYVEIQLSKEQTQFILKIADNGSGFNFDKAKLKGGIGLRNLESRVRYLNGQLNVSTENGQGSAYKISIPYD